MRQDQSMAADQRPLRGDAVANRAAIVDAAARLWVRVGDAVPFGAIAREAGVGVGTLYRHFPDRAALAEAVVDRSYDQVAGFATAAAVRPGPALDAVGWFFDQVVSASPQLVLPLLGRIAVTSADAAGHREREHEISDALEALIARAVGAGAIGAGVRSTDLIVASAALASVRLPGDTDGRSTARLRAILLSGLAVGVGGNTLDAPEALTRDELTRAMPQND
jgi:AcrR family transcriptional regulator